MAVDCAGGNLHILVCEGNQSVSRRLGRWLERAGIHYDWAPNVSRARQWLDRHDYDALTVNLVMPDQGGLSFVHELRSAGHPIPVLGLTIREISRRQGLPLPVGSAADWLDAATEQARVIFALKVASREVPGYRPRVLNVQSDAYAAEVIAHGLADCAEVVHATSLAQLQRRLLTASFDLVVLNPDLPDDPDGRAPAMVAALRPCLPMILHATYRIMDDADDARAVGPAGTAAGLVETIRCFATAPDPVQQARA
ncbi:MAG TPA: response regulator [Gammaproteobacteria bacterium]|nr:response regulator [Gammaproteobacteria bacterium]